MNTNILNKKSTKLVTKIHNEFNGEVELLLVEAKKTRIHNDEFWSKAEKLKKSGFINVNEVVTAENDIKINEDKLFLANAIEYFTIKYPLYKFITEESIIKICKKYKLIYGNVTNYIGHIPDKNINEIFNNRVDLNDKTHVVHKNWFLTIQDRLYHTREDLFVSYIKGQNCISNSNIPPSGYSEYGKQFTDLKLKPLVIVAPRHDFNTKNKKLINFRLFEKPVPDPVVLQSVMYKDKEFFLVLSAWGNEASDELVVNQNMN